ncbi:MAG: DUF4394 domain-containing protein [Gemmatimonadales bacterium]
MRRLKRLTAILVLSLTFGCGGSDGSGPPIGVPAPVIYGLDSANTLVVFRATRPDLVTRTTAITGLQAAERVVGIDFRPADGKLYAVGTSSRIYVVDTTSGVATAVGTVPFTPVLLGTAFGIDFNPVVDRLRAVSDTDQNLRLDPVTGGVAGVDTALAYAAGDPGLGVNPSVVAVAYTNSVPGAATTTLYGIDAGRAVLVTLASPNGGQLTTVGSLGVSTSRFVGFDIAGATGIGYVTLVPPAATTSRFYVVNLGTGGVTLTGNVNHGVPLVGITVHR